MKISIVTVVYRAEKTIGDALESVARQGWDDIEHVVVDGASPDRTLEVVRNYASANMIVVSEPDEGIYDALNKGYRLSTGDVVGIVHADDILAGDDVVRRVAEAFADPDVDAVYGDLDYVSKEDPTQIVRHWKAGEFSKSKLRAGWMPPHPTLFLRRSVFEVHGLFDTSFRIAADYDLILRYLGVAGIRPAYIPDVLVKMRVGGESNRSFSAILKKTREDYRALRKNQIGGIVTLVAKNLSKIPQFYVRD